MYTPRQVKIIVVMAIVAVALFATAFLVEAEECPKCRRGPIRSPQVEEVEQEENYAHLWGDGIHEGIDCIVFKEPGMEYEDYIAICQEYVETHKPRELGDPVTDEDWLKHDTGID